MAVIENPLTGVISRRIHVVTFLLQNERANIERILEPMKNIWTSKGVSIVSDGWLDAQRRHIINFMVIIKSMDVS